ncbi:hypothetical protein ACVMIH_002370 [Bradyrhizobium sp. USDA 4503]
MPKPKPWTAEEERRLLELRRGGLKWIRIAAELDRSEASVVGRYLKHLKNRRPETVPEQGNLPKACKRQP